MCTNSAFCVDDTQNQPLADWYGIAMGTSHEEPMMRSVPVEWNLFGQGPLGWNSTTQYYAQRTNVLVERGAVREQCTMERLYNNAHHIE